MTAAGEPLRLYPTRRDPAPRPGDPKWRHAKEIEKDRSALVQSARTATTRLVKVLDDVEILDRDGYLEVAVERLVAYHERAADAMFELTGELAELVARSSGYAIERNEFVDEPSDPAACTCGHPECGAC